MVTPKKAEEEKEQFSEAGSTEVEGVAGATPGTPSKTQTGKAKASPKQKAEKGSCKESCSKEESVPQENSNQETKHQGKQWKWKQDWRKGTNTSGQDNLVDQGSGPV
jgi:hypothetical protein